MAWAAGCVWSYSAAGLGVIVTNPVTLDPPGIVRRGGVLPQSWSVLAERTHRSDHRIVCIAFGVDHARSAFVTASRPRMPLASQSVDGFEEAHISMRLAF